MVRKCILCDELIGCEKGQIKVECDECRLVEGCSIQHFFTTTNITYGLCRFCRKILGGRRGVLDGETIQISP